MRRRSVLGRWGGTLPLVLVLLTACLDTTPPVPSPAMQTSIAATQTAVRAVTTPGPVTLESDVIPGDYVETNSDSFLLPAGNYRVEWWTESLNMDGDLASVKPALISTDGSLKRDFDETTDREQSIMYDLPAGRYYVRVKAACAWRLTITPLTPP